MLIGVLLHIVRHTTYRIDQRRLYRIPGKPGAVESIAELVALDGFRKKNIAKAVLCCDWSRSQSPGCSRIFQVISRARTLKVVDICRASSAVQCVNLLRMART